MLQLIRNNIPRVREAFDENIKTLMKPCSHPDAIIKLEVDKSKLKPMKQYPIEVAYRLYVDTQIEEWLKEGVIKEAPPREIFCSPLWTVPKRNLDGTIDKSTRRVCLDARRLNEALVNMDNFPVPVIRDIFANLQGAKIFSEIDIRQAYTQFPVEVESQQYLGFTWRNKAYCFIRAIFGLRFMTSRFQRVMKSITQGISNVEIYVDNIIIFSKTLDEHIDTIVKVIILFTKWGLTIKEEKCKLGLDEIRMLGHLINAMGIRIDPNKYEMIDNLKIPRTGLELESILGLTNYFRMFLAQYSKIAAPLELIRKEKVLVWKSEHQQALELLKTGIKNAGILCYPDFEEPFHLATDASYSGLGAVLFQKEGKQDKIIECVSRALTESEQNYSATKLELAGVVFALKRFRTYLIQRPFTLYTDHSALVSLFKAKFEKNLLTNTWFETIMDFITL